MRQLEQAKTGSWFSDLRTVFVVLALLLLCASPVAAQGKLKKLVFEDCGEAKKALETLESSQQIGFYQYLTRVLKMQTGVTSELLGDIPIGPMTGGPGTDISRVLDPTRENDAKFCAIDLLIQDSRGAVQVLPELVAVVGESNNSLELLERIEATVWILVKETPPLVLDARWFNQLLAQLDNDKSGYLAANVLMELNQRALPRILDSLSTNDPKKVSAAQTLLLRLSQAEIPVGPPLLRLLESSDDELRIKAAQVLSAIPSFRNQSIPALLRRLTDPSTRVSQGVYDALGELLDSRGEGELDLSLSEDAMKSLVQAFENARPSNREVLEKLLLQIQLPAGPVSQQTFDLAKAADPDLRERAIRIISAKASGSAPLPPVIFEALYDTAYTTRLAAMKGMSKSQTQSEEKLTALLRALKSNASEKDSSVREEFLLGAASLVSKLPLSASALRTVPYFIEGLAIHAPKSGSEPKDFNLRDYTEQEIVQVLVHLGKASVAPALKELKDVSWLVRARAVAVLSQVRPLERSTGKQVLFMLRDPDPNVRRVTENVLPAFGNDVTPDLRKALLWKEADGQLAAAKVLLTLGVRDAAVESALRDGFNRIDCGSKLFLVDTLVSGSTDYRERVTSLLAECIWSSPREPIVFVDKLQGLIPLHASVNAQLVEKLQSQTVPKSVQLEILSRATALELPKPEVVTILRTLIAEEDNSLRIRALAALIPLGREAQAAVPDLLRLVDDGDEEGLLRNTAVNALIEIQPEAYDWKKYFLKELKGDRYLRAINSISEMKPANAVAILKKAIEEVAPDHRSAVLNLVGNLEAEAAELKPEIVKLLGDNDALIRYNATIALAKVDPGALELESALRRQLNGRFAWDLTAERLSQTVIPGLEEIIAHSSTIAEKSAAQELLRNIRQGSESNIPTPGRLNYDGGQ